MFTTLDLGIIKISVILFYRRLFTVRSFKIASSVMLGIVAVWTIVFTSVTAGQCYPLTTFWTSFEIDYGSNCIQVQMFYQSLAFSDLIMDVIVLASPIPVVLSLRIPWRKKIAVIDVLLLGTL